MNLLQCQVRVGDRVRARGQRWRVADLRVHDNCTLVTLVGIGPGNAGIELGVLTPFDEVDRLAGGTRRRVVGIRRWRRVCRHLIASHGSSGALHAATGARILLMPHQLEPALAVVTGRGSRILIADEVGLGKTIQAALILAELRARGAVDRVLVLTPAGLRDQWANELSDRFGIRTAVVDMREARRRAALMPVGTNPWTAMPTVIASIDYIKRPEVRPSLEACRWDLVIIDEAHNAAAASDRYDAAAALCARAPYVLLLTATPHNGDTAAFSSLCGIGARGDRLIVFRRTRRDVALGPRRRVHTLPVRTSEPELRMHGELARVAALVGAHRSHEVTLVLSLLHKRAMSSARSLELSVRRRIAVLEATSGDGAWQLPLPLYDGGRDETDAADAPPVWTSALVADPDDEHRLLTRVADAARVASAAESKINALKRLLARLARAGEGVIVFTEYRDTLMHVRDSVAPGAAVLHGAMTREERRHAIQQFTTGGVPLLLATDAAGEGLNLHHACRCVVNLELPWNPTRLEQRIGRVDRIGQQRTVHAFHLVARGTGEGRLLQRLKARIARAHEAIGAADPLGQVAQEGEAAASRLVIDGVEPAARLPPTDLEVPLHRLQPEAAREHGRLVLARAMVGDDTAVDADHDAAPLVARARRWRTRVRLGGRELLVHQTICVDACGRRVASVVSATLRSPGSDPEAARGGTLPAVEAHEQFWAARLRREQAIVQDAQRSMTVQPGLFDNRAERLRQAEAGRAATAPDDIGGRLDAAIRNAETSMQPAHTVLVLKP